MKDCTFKPSLNKKSLLLNKSMKIEDSENRPSSKKNESRMSRLEIMHAQHKKT